MEWEGEGTIWMVGERVWGEGRFELDALDMDFYFVVVKSDNFSWIIFHLDSVIGLITLRETYIWDRST